MSDLTSSTGSAKQMYDVYSQSLEARISDLKRAFEGLYEKILSSDSLKWMVTELTQLVTALTNVDGKTIAFIATIGSLVVIMSKLATLNKTLLMEEAVTGLSKFIALASGMAVVGEATTGLSTAFGFLGTSIKGATVNAMAFMATPIGAVIAGITAVIGVAVAGFVAYKQHQEELTEQSKSLKTALEGVNSALKGGDIKGANENLDKIKKELDEYKKLTDLKKEYQNKLANASDNKNIAGMYGISETEQYTATIKNLDKQLEEHKKVLNDAGISEETFAQKQQQVNYQDQINTIKEMTKSQVENRINVEANKEEYNNYIAKIQELYSEYQNLSAQESLSSEEKTRLGSVVDQLQGQFGNLNVKVDENGRCYIENTPLIQDSIGYLNQEGVTVDTLSQIRVNEARTHASCQIGDTQMTYGQVTQRIQMYKSEIAAIQQTMNAQYALAQGNGEIVGANDTEYNEKDNEQNDAVEHRIRANAQARWNAMNVELQGLESKKSEIDNAYNSITLPTAPSGGGTAIGNEGYMPSGGGSKAKKGKSDAEKEAEKALKEAEEWTKKINDLKSDVKDTDMYYDANNIIKQLDNSMTALKTSEEGLTGIPLSETKQKEVDVLNQQIEAQKRLQSLQELEKGNLENTLSNYGILVDSTGNLSNAYEVLTKKKQEANNMQGSSEVEYEAKKNSLQQVKDLNDLITRHNELVNDEIPKTIDKWKQYGNEVKKTNEEIQKTYEDTVNSMGEKIVAGLKQEYENQKTEELKKLKEEYQEDADDLQDEIDTLQKRLDNLNDESVDNETKLAKLKSEKALWEKELASGNDVFAKGKVVDLDKEIKSLSKTIEKDSLQKQIDDINKKKSAREDDYNKEVSSTEEKYKDLENEHKLFNKAEELLTTKNTKRIKELLSSQDESFKQIGTTLGESLNKPIQDEINNTITAIDNLINKINELSEAKEEKKSTKKKTTSGKTYTVESNGNVLLGDITPKEYEAEIARFDTGGRTSGNISSDGGLAIVDPKEKILNAEDTITFDESMLKLNKMYSYIMENGALLTQLSQSYSNIGNYTIPTYSTDLNSIANNVTSNTNNDNSSYSPIEMHVNIINQNGAEAIANEKNLEKMVTKIVQKNATKYGGKGFNNR